ncbi:MAG: alpha/beta hydrolase [Tannerellaceae bacterium]|jgi:acetyl esterase/lipase|nr:alpha/beta hydrolase [Tannerellaceae bacterium]
MKKNFGKITFLFALFLYGFLSASSQETINLYEGAIPGNIKNDVEERFVDAPYGRSYSIVTQPTLQIYLPPKEKNTGIAVVICPGGGYVSLSYTHEGIHMAKRFAESGIAGIVLKYRLPDASLFQNKETIPLQDAQRALILVRQNASRWGIHPDKVGMMGSSAGGHLASTAGTHFEKCYAPNPKALSVRPDFLILNYPVISLADSITHHGSKLRLIGENVAAEKALAFSNERNVTSRTPPTFIIHANDDTVVPIQNSILFMAALQQAGVKTECFFYAKGGHGFGMDNPYYDIDWVDRCIRWVKEIMKMETQTL